VNPAIYFEPDGYLLTGPKLMGRQSAGNGFLRAVIAGRGDEPVKAYGLSQASATAFREFVAQVDPSAKTEWIAARRFDLLGQAGLLYRPDQILGPMARQRLRAGPAAYSLCGVTHTLATHTTLDAIARLLLEPVMPWDALVCTSSVAHAVVTAVIDEAADYHQWVSGHRVERELPMLPIIPLGVHCSDFDFTDADRLAARRDLGLAEDEVVVLSAGRLSRIGKSHPFATFRALQQTATETGKALVLMFAGQAFNEVVLAAYRSGAATFCPGVRVVFVDGQDPDNYRRAWAGADLFVSLADSVQETFGLTPLEAMAAGLPALVSDWDGYKDTVRDGVDGFRIRTWAPAPGGGQAIAEDYEAGSNGYEQYLARCNTAVAVEMGELTARLRDLVTDRDLRRRMGAAGQARARSNFDWAQVYRSYRSLWTHQAATRRRAAADPASREWLARAPKRAADHMGPFDTFASYPTRHVTARTQVSLAADQSSEAYLELVEHPLFSAGYVPPAAYEVLRDALRSGPATVEDLARRSNYSLLVTIEIVTRLAKIDVLALSDGDAQSIS
jgi:starch synthase